MRALILLLALAGCGLQPSEINIPPNLNGTWTLSGAPIESLEQAWPEARLHGLKTLGVATYSGPGDPRVFLHKMASDAGAFETLQHWHPESGAAAFQYGIFFVVVRSPALSQAELTQFAAEFEQGLSKLQK